MNEREKDAKEFERQTKERINRQEGKCAEETRKKSKKASKKQKRIFNGNAVEGVRFRVRRIEQKSSNL